MIFSEQLNTYIDRLGCTAKELAEASGLSASIISRYRKGERAPAIKSESLQKLTYGISALAGAAGLDDIRENTVLDALCATLKQNTINMEQMTENLNALISVLNISPSELARSMSYDASYISRIRAGQRRPANPEAFADGVCRFVVRRYRREEDKAAAAGLIGYETALSHSQFFIALKNWLCNGTADSNDYVGHFLAKLDEFDLNDYIRSIHFDELRVPSLPFQLPGSKTYCGTVEMRAGELDFFKATVLSKSTEPVFMCSDMPMEDLAEDLNFSKKWMFGIAMMLKKGLHLDMVHNIDRPFAEMMLGLESWIPIYMTGQVSPYYLRGRHNDVYCHFNYVSGAAALTGECITGHHADGKYYLTKKRKELAYYKKKAAFLLKKAQLLMDIYKPESERVFNAFLNADAKTDGTRHSILTAPPIYTLPENMLERILLQASVSGSDRAKLLAYAAKQREMVEAILERNTILDELHSLSADEFAKYPATLSLTGAFYDKDIFYTYEEYLKHLRLTEEYAQMHPNYTVNLSMARAFRNIQIKIHEGKWAMISKNKSPVIHFVIRQPKLREAIENMIMPVVE